MSLSELLYVAIGALIIRQVAVLLGILRSRRFLQDSVVSKHVPEQVGDTPVFYVVIPVLREAEGLRRAIDHFEALIEAHTAEIIIVTTAREAAEAAHHPNAGDSVAVAKDLTNSGRAAHLHYPDPQGLKADQLNFAVASCLSSLSVGAKAERTFLVIYDADSRPPLDSLEQFTMAIAQNPESSVFHQSSRFELREERRRANSSVIKWLLRTICDSGALRANRFVLGFEIPRLLNRSMLASAFKRWMYSYIYVHVTGHGLCIRLSLLQELPFPERSPLEDMHYSFLLGSRNSPMVPISSLDSADVPESVRIQFEQLIRWFLGPARFRRYLADQATQRGWRARLLAMSAAGIAVGWMSCSILPIFLMVLLWSGSIVIRALVLVLIVTYALQLFVVDRSIGSDVSLVRRAARLIISPVTCTLFGVAGLVGLGFLVLGKSAAGKTERCQL